MIKGIGFEHKKFNFPCGEMQVVLTEYRPNSKVSLHFEFEKNEEIIELLLVANALKRQGIIIEDIALPYIPFSRQDRVCNPGEAFSLKVFADVINSLNVKEINVWDPHSDVATALINNCKVVEQHKVFEKYLKDREDFFLICPDGGALKKIYKLASKVSKCLGVIECSKIRNVKNGEITGVKIHDNWNDELHACTGSLYKKDCILVDDICDGGRTFIEIAKKLKERQPNKIILCVTHGFFTKGIEVFDGLIDEIYTRNGKVK